MERFVADLFEDLERGKMDRRQFCETIALAASVYAAGEAAANAAPAEGFKAIAVNHISYACPDYRMARDWYATMFGMNAVKEKDDGKTRASLTFGPEPGQGGSYFIARNFRADPPQGPAPKAVVDHICYTIPDWDEAKVRAALKAKGYPQPTGRDGSLHVYDPFDYDVQIANAVQENAFRR